MSVDLHALGIDRLSVGDRLELIDLLSDSLPETVQPADVPAWHLAELVKRRQEAESMPGMGRPWRQVLEDLKNGQ